jgi:hypothetical protein
VPFVPKGPARGRWAGILGGKPAGNRVDDLDGFILPDIIKQANKFASVDTDKRMFHLIAVHALDERYSGLCAIVETFKSVIFAHEDNIPSSFVHDEPPFGYPSVVIIDG